MLKRHRQAPVKTVQKSAIVLVQLDWPWDPSTAKYERRNNTGGRGSVSLLLVQRTSCFCLLENWSFFSNWPVAQSKHLVMCVDCFLWTRLCIESWGWQDNYQSIAEGRPEEADSTACLLCLRVLPPQIHPTADWKYSINYISAEHIKTFSRHYPLNNTAKQQFM